jgi:hypothetical protein
MNILQQLTAELQASTKWGQQLELELEIAHRGIAVGMESGKRLEKNITDLQALIRDFVAFTDIDGPTVKVWSAEWRAERDALSERARTLLGEE